MCAVESTSFCSSFHLRAAGCGWQRLVTRILSSRILRVRQCGLWLARACEALSRRVQSWNFESSWCVCVCLLSTVCGPQCPRFKLFVQGSKKLRIGWYGFSSGFRYNSSCHWCIITLAGYPAHYGGGLSVAAVCGTFPECGHVGTETAGSLAGWVVDRLYLNPPNLCQWQLRRIRAFACLTSTVGRLGIRLSVTSELDDFEGPAGSAPACSSSMLLMVVRGGDHLLLLVSCPVCSRYRSHIFCRMVFLSSLDISSEFRYGPGPRAVTSSQQSQ